MNTQSTTQVLLLTHSAAGRSFVRRSMLVILATVILAAGANAQGVGISESSITPDASAILELRSTTRGFLMPRNSATLGFSVQGLSFYNTTSNRLNYHNGSTWLEIPVKSDNLSVFASTTSAQLLALLSDKTGTGLAVFATSPSFTTPDIGAATGTSLSLGGGTALTTTNRTGTGNLVLATSPTLVTPELGVATGASLALGGGSALTTTNQTGTGNLVLANTPTLVTPVLGAATGTSLALGGGSPLTTTNQTGTGNLVLANTPTLVTPVLGVATGTSLALGGGTPLTTTNQTGSGNLVLATSPTLTTPTIGAATATSVNNVAITNPGTAATLTLANNSTLATSGAFSTTLTATAATNVTLPTTGTLATVPEIDQITADQTRNLTTFADVPGFSYSLLANSTYYFKFKCLVTTNATTVGILLAVNASAAITSINYIHMYPTSATAITYERVTALNGGTLPTAGPGATQREYTLEGTIVTSGAVTFTLRHRSETASITTVKAGSFGMVQKIL
ncbi:MAG: hypothetical protein HUU02_11335 [Bacteroidetes bacterium]|nr:hypothetical protein [Bacteroidota bacterium]